MTRQIGGRLFLSCSLVVTLLGCPDDTEVVPDGAVSDLMTDGDLEDVARSDTTTDEDPAETPDSNETPELMSLYQLVDPFIGTGGDGVRSPNCFPGAVAPFGMVQVSPDTVMNWGGASWYNHSAGYHYDDGLVLGFSHTRLQGTSTPDFGAVLLMPAIGGDLSELATRDGRRSRLDKSTETAQPGYYAVTLESGIRVELTATDHSAHHRYHYPDEGAAQVVIDLSHALVDAEVIAADLHVIEEDSAVEGWVQTNGRETSASGDGLITWFHARVEPSFAAWSTWNAGAPVENVAEQTGPEVGAIVSANPDGDRYVEVKVGISYVDIEGARANLEADIGAQDFEATRAAVRALWEEELSVLQIGGGTEEQRVMVATGLYHNLIVPNLFADANGEYRGFDNEVHTAEGYRYHANFSMWDTYRTTHPLLILLRPDRSREMVLSLMAVAEEGGYLPRWPAGHGYTNDTVGSPADVVIAESALKGIDGFDRSVALEMMLQTASTPTEPGHPFSGREGIAGYVELGYVPSDVEARATSQTLEFAIADMAIARLAELLGEDEQAAIFFERARSYENLWEPDVAVFSGRKLDGSWVEPYDPLIYQDHNLYYGGNGLQHAWLAPHDMLGLVGLHESPEVFSERLESFFESSVTEEEGLNEITRYIPPKYYYHGNEPDIHAPYLFLAVGRPDLTQRWVHWVSETFHSAEPDGIAGNEDAGAMSAWLVWSSLGLYPMAASDVYLVGRPLFPVAEVAVPGGTLRIEAPSASDERFYVQSATLDGDELPHPWVHHDDIADGGMLRFEMGSEPGVWGRDFGDPLTE